MLKFQTPMLNDEVCRAMTDKQTNTQTNTQTYILSKNWGNLFLTAKFFLFSIFITLIDWTLKRAVSNTLYKYTHTFISPKTWAIIEVIKSLFNVPIFISFYINETNLWMELTRYSIQTFLFTYHNVWYFLLGRGGQYVPIYLGEPIPWHCGPS